MDDKNKIDIHIVHFRESEPILLLKNRCVVYPSMKTQQNLDNTSFIRQYDVMTEKTKHSVPALPPKDKGGISPGGENQRKFNRYFVVY